MSEHFHDELIEIEERVHRARAELEIAEDVPKLREQVTQLEREVEQLGAELAQLAVQKRMAEVTSKLDARRRRIRLFSAWCLAALLAGVWTAAHLASLQSELVDEPRAHSDLQHWPVPFEAIRGYVMPPPPRHYPPHSEDI